MKIDYDEDLLELNFEFDSGVKAYIPISKINELFYCLRGFDSYDLNELADITRMRISEDSPVDAKLPILTQKEADDLLNIIDNFIKNNLPQKEIELVKNNIVVSPFGHYTAIGREILLKNIRKKWQSLSNIVELNQFSIYDGTDLINIYKTIKKNKNKIHIMSISIDDYKHTAAIIFSNNNFFVFDSAGSAASQCFEGISKGLDSDIGTYIVYRFMEHDSRYKMYFNINPIQSDIRNCCVFTYDFMDNICGLINSFKDKDKNSALNNYLVKFFNVPFDKSSRIFCEGDLNVLNSAISAFNDEELKKMEPGCRKKLLLPPEFLINAQFSRSFFDKVKNIYGNENEFKEITFTCPPVINVNLHKRKNLTESLKDLLIDFRTTKKLKTKIKDDIRPEILNRRNSKNKIINTIINNRINKKRDEMDNVLYRYLKGN